MEKVISGGQTGVDQAALDAAIHCGVNYGGWLPAGRMTENGPLPQKYRMEELSTPSYPLRTRKNVDDADATLIISRGNLTGGSELTQRYAVSKGKPCFHMDLLQNDMDTARDKICRWLNRHDPAILNVAGPRASSDNVIYERAYSLMVNVLQICYGV